MKHLASLCPIAASPTDDAPLVSPDFDKYVRDLLKNRETGRAIWKADTCASPNSKSILLRLKAFNLGQGAD